MGVKNFETGVLVQKFDQGSANCVPFFFQQRTLTRRPLALEYFTPTKFAKNLFLQHKWNAVWSENQISAKNPNVKINLFWYTIFSGNSAASLLLCLSEKKVPVFSEKFDIFVSENFFLNSTILVKFCD